MNICMLAYSFYDNDNRVMRYAETLAKRGDHVDVIALKKEGQASIDKINGVNIYRIQKRIVDEKGRLSYLFKLIYFFINSSIFITRKHLKKAYDLLHIHSVPDFEVFAGWLPKLMGSKIILDIHDIVPEFYAAKFSKNNNSLIYKILILLEKISIRFSDHVIISNHLWKKTLISRSVKENKCTTILNYPDPLLFCKHKIKSKNNKFIIVYPGTLNWHQGLDIAINAFALIKDKIQNAFFYIYGNGSSEDYLNNLINELRLENRIFLKKRLPINEIVNVIENADLGIVPKRNDSFGNEAFSTKILEFMALGVPVIISSTRIDRYYFDESLVRFFKPEDVMDLAESIILLAENEKLRKYYANNAQRYIENNNWEAKKHIYLNLIDTIFNNSNPSKQKR